MAKRACILHDRDLNGRLLVQDAIREIVKNQLMTKGLGFKICVRGGSQMV